MKTKEQKKKELDEHIKRIGESATLIFADFNKVPTKELTTFKKQLRALQTSFKVAKKRILKIAFGEKNIKADLGIASAQLGVIFSPKELVNIASKVHAFSKVNYNFKIIGGYDLNNGEFLEADFIKRVSMLPSREVLIAQLVSMIAAPLKMFMLVLKEKEKKDTGLVS